MADIDYGAQELIKVKGNQVAPAELEAVLMAYDGIADAAVIGVKKQVTVIRPRSFTLSIYPISSTEKTSRGLWRSIVTHWTILTLRTFQW